MVASWWTFRRGIGLDSPQQPRKGHALVADLGLDRSATQPWPVEAPDGGDRSMWLLRGEWLLFNTDGTGYGVAIASTVGDGKWIAVVDHVCAAVVPLPVAPDGSSSPSAGPPS